MIILKKIYRITTNIIILASEFDTCNINTNIINVRDE
jgi:hypothetical protein